MKTYPNHTMTDAEARQALADACKQVETNLPLYTYQCQNHSMGYKPAPQLMSEHQVRRYHSKAK